MSNCQPHLVKGDSGFLKVGGQPLIGLGDLNDELERLAAGSKLTDAGRAIADGPNTSKNMGAKEDTNIPAPKTDKTEGRNARTGKTVSKTGTIKGSKGGKEEKVNTEQINSCAPEPMTAKEKR